VSDTRTPVVSGTHYAALPARLRADLRALLATAPAPRRARGVVVPHDALRYSGRTAADALGAVEVPATCLVLAPNLTGRRSMPQGASLLTSKRYRTPLGEVEVDAELARAIAERSIALVADDEVAHAEEESVEALLPLLQLRNPDVRIVPLLLSWGDWERTALLARAIAGACAGRDDVLVVAASNMHAGASADAGADIDSLALDRVIRLDGEGLLRVVVAEGIAMSGAVPVACACEAVRQLGGTAGELVGYSHSGLATGRQDGVVGYAAVLLGAR